MGLLGWIRTRLRGSEGSRRACDFCSDPTAVMFDELAVDEANSTYLCRCPRCGQYWGGHAYTPQYWWELSPEEASAFFPDYFTAGGELGR